MPVMRLPCFWSCKASVTTTSSRWPIREPANADAKIATVKNPSDFSARGRKREGRSARQALAALTCAEDTLGASVPPTAQLVRGEAVEQAVAAGASQIVLAAAAVGPARGMRRVPRFRRRIVAQTLAVAVADHRGALGAARPVAAGSVLAGRKRPPVHLRAGQDVVGVGGVAHTGNHGAPLGQRHRHAEFVAVAVEIVDVLGDNLAFEILPRAVSD